MWRSVPPISVMVLSSWCRLTAKATSCPLEDGLSQDLFDGGDPRLDLLHPAHAQGEHALLEGLPLDLHRGGADHDEVADPLGDLHDLVEAHPALVARAVAGAAALALVELEGPHLLGGHPDLDQGLR